MSVKIFVPTDLFYAKENCDIYGEIQINENNAVSYFVIASSHFNTTEDSAPSNTCRRLRHLGHILRTGPATALQRRDVSLSFAYDAETPNIYLDKLSIKPANAAHVYVFLYDIRKVLQLHDCAVKKKLHEAAADQYDDMRMLYNLLQKSYKNAFQTDERNGLQNVLCAGLNLPLDAMSRVFVTIMEWQPVKCILQCTAFYEHYQEWKKFRATRKRNLNIAVDRILGICFMMMLLCFIPQLGDFLMLSSHHIVKKLRSLLGALKGSPIGLKLNVQLNNFLLDCFNYHINLWDLFLDVIEPVVRQLLMPIALLGSLGLSYQLALLADLISVMGLHAYCFYVYAAVLYKVEIRGLQVLWKVVLGKRYNVLKGRVESHNFMNRQLYLATIFFTCLLFLFPTVLVYYIVFTTVRLCIYSINLVLQQLRRYILEFPLQMFCQLLRGNFFEIESLQLQYLEATPSPLLQSEERKMKMSVFKIKVQSSSLDRVFLCESGVLQELTEDKRSLIKTIFNRILEGKL